MILVAYIIVISFTIICMYKTYKNIDKFLNARQGQGTDKLIIAALWFVGAFISSTLSLFIYNPL